MAKKEKIIIGLSTAGSNIKIALKNAAGKFRIKSVKEFNQEKVFFKIIEKLLSFEKAELKDIGGICVVKGPGRFTGIRISLTFASMMKALIGIKVFTVTAFEILAFQAFKSLAFKKWLAKAKNPKIVVILHAFKKEYFLQIFKPLLRQGYEGQAGRKEKGIKIKQLSARSGLTESSISMIENGKISPSITTINKIAMALSVHPIEFFEIEKHKKWAITRKGEREKSQRFS